MVKQRKIVIGMIACITAALFLAFAATIGSRDDEIKGGI
jgi:hypothetical protein